LDSRLRGNDETSLDAIVTRGMAHLTAYQDAAYAKQFANFVAKVRTREQSLGADASLPFTRAVAASLLKLMAYKDEYEVARLYTDGEFRRSLQQQFEGEVQLEFYMAPPVLSRARAGQPPRKVRLGGWMLPAMKLLARGRRLRGTAFDLFGRTLERRMERELIAQYRARIDALLPALAPERLKLATDIAALPLSMRGFGHVKLANVALARAREAELLHRFDPATYPQPDRAPRAGQLRGIAVTAQAT
jgi:indolepyruvate ferredoxin oxidoreductase